jgi:hypothetical protein
MGRIEAAPSTVVAMLFRSVGVVAVLAVPTISGLGSVAVPTPGDRADPQEQTAWLEAYSERYPGCVPAVLWPQDEHPVAVVVKASDGRIERVALDDHRRPVQPLPSDARTIGACR